ncbi:hypothetical protein A9G13_07690 [Gilliamella sp. wkB178]|uniref:metallophosphoesterase n=1 Tax=Gilliamella sp. wkB178 TaxID=3120259 RepID=UPI00080E4339|nr:metallophosphoesterase [Gilliamella apicola]OCG08070.1 hypothetical protein A9G13_07690 [Gilliamella apicola]
MSFIAIIAIIVSLLITIYLGKRWQFWFNFELTGYSQIAYWVVMIVAGLSFILSKIFNGISTYWLPLISNVILGLIICAIFITLIFDAIRWLSKGRFTVNLLNKIIYIVCVVGLFIFGHEMAINPKIVEYQVKIDKPANVDHLRLVQLTDIHVNELTTHKSIQQMIDKVNQLNADFIVITGDTLDQRLKPFTELGFDKQFQQLKAKYGTYIVFGNHEYLGTTQADNSEQDIIKTFQQAKMKVLKDDIVYLDDVGITLIGRDDLSSSRYDVTRASLSDLIMFADTSTPIILLDHQPKDLDEPANLGVDLMISGHTHRGQVFPINLVVAAMYKNSYGMYQNPEQHFTSIVSSGYGLWGPPIRLMSRSEIAVIDITFNNQQKLTNSPQ